MRLHKSSTFLEEHMDLLGMFLSLALLMFLAYRSLPVILLAPVCSLVAVAIAGYPLLLNYTEIYMPSMAGYFRNFFPIFLLGAVFGKLMDETGSAMSISRYIARTLGADKAIMAVIISGMILTYGGISVVVIAFAIYPFATALYKEAGIPKRLIPANIASGAFACAMTALPGSPQIQNIIPTRYFGTDLYAAPGLGIIACIVMVGGAYWWLARRKAVLMAGGEGYGINHINEPVIDPDQDLPNPWVAMIPLATVLVLNFLFTRWVGSWDPSILEGYSATLDTVKANWALIISLVISIILAIGLNWRFLKGPNSLTACLTAGTVGSLLAILNTAAEVGYGGCISKLPAFQTVVDWLMSIDSGGSPLLSMAVVVNVLAGITGSSSGGLSIVLETMGAQYLEWANAVGMNPELLPRVGAVAASCFDTLPHYGSIVTLLGICGLTHRQSFPDIFVCLALMPLAATITIVTLAYFFGCF
jgi:H+/gluconate symporter-like permease